MSARPWLIFSSSTGQTFRAFHQALDKDSRASLKGFFTDRPCAAAAIARQELESAPVYELDKKGFEAFVLDWIEKKEISDGVILLCGFFGILSADFLSRCPLPVINTHPSLLPAFPGLDHKVQRLAWETVPVSGFSVHMVTPELDGGALIFQQPVALDPRWSEEESRREVRAAEQKWLPRVWASVIRSRVSKDDLSLSSRELRLKHGFHEFGFEEKKI
jgi:folate-dependent phosphoribosylglycinamide formyltransferase PurN